ncbi:TPA: hypothetical protein VN232_001007 [Streptococcus pyogenes]|nr:hypothetical protein [Streptococcus pyogenes]
MKIKRKSTGQTLDTINFVDVNKILSRKKSRKKAPPAMLVGKNQLF